MWPEADGVIVEGFSIGFCYADDTSITANGFVKVGTHAASRVPVAVSALCGDAIGMAMKTPVAIGDMIPVLFYGVAKVTTAYADTSLKPYIGSFLMNSTATTVTGVGALVLANLELFTGASYILGMALQTPGATADEILALVGKCI